MGRNCSYLGTTLVGAIWHHVMYRLIRMFIPVNFAYCVHPLSRPTILVRIFLPHIDMHIRRDNSTGLGACDRKLIPRTSSTKLHWSGTSTIWTIQVFHRGTTWSEFSLCGHSREERKSIVSRPLGFHTSSSLTDICVVEWCWDILYSGLVSFAHWIF